MIHFFNSLAILTVVGMITLAAGEKTQGHRVNIVDTTIEYESSINRTMKINSPKNMQQDKVQFHMDYKGSIL
jgi:hypothetical protein